MGTTLDLAELSRTLLGREHKLLNIDVGNDKETIAEVLPEIAVLDVDLSNAVVDQRNNIDIKTSEEKEMDAFLVEVNKKALVIKLKRRGGKMDQRFETVASSCTKGGDGKVNKAVNIQIPELSLEAILTGTSEVTAQIIVDLLRVTMKLRCKEILCWYCYYKAYEDRVRDVKSKNGVDDKSARTLVYSEIKPLLPDITDVNLHKITFRKKSIYCLMG
ncbi:unnamed protein product [Rhizophagus irregularis]|nr:unnamed protein product [Rhizophagus irregularis]